MNLAYCCRACTIASLQQKKNSTSNLLVHRDLDSQIDLTRQAFILCPNCANPSCPRADDHRNPCVRQS